PAAAACDARHAVSIAALAVASVNEAIPAQPGLPPTLVVFATGLSSCDRRPTTKNQIRSFFSGPPIDRSKSWELPSLSVLVTPTSFSSCAKLSLCHRSIPSEEVPEKRLPPSRGTMLMLRPPVGASAPPPPVWYTISWLPAVVK